MNRAIQADAREEPLWIRLNARSDEDEPTVRTMLESMQAHERQQRAAPQNQSNGRVRQGTPAAKP